MSKISLKHSGGNVVSLNSPTNAPGAADVAFKLPNADGSAGQFMKTDGSGNLSFDAVSAGITMADSWRITSNFNNNAIPLTSNWERGDLSPYEGYLGSAGLTESSGVFSFPSTGWYFINYSHDFATSSDSDYIYMGLDITNDSGSNYTSLSYAAAHTYGGGDTLYHTSSQSSLFKITNVSTQKIRFYVERQAGTVVTLGNTNRKQTGFDIFRLGDT